MKSRVSVILTFTTSKLLAYIVLAIGSTYSFMFKDEPFYYNIN